MRGTSATPKERRQAQRIHGLYRAWNRNRSDLDILQQLHAAIGDYLVSSTMEAAPREDQAD
ncbi:hypothetical protein SAMN04488546_4573 [Geodermatophilus poikilotrophus]|uniref:Uncharacterized protein n=1 Tax=Geodermatophilus poikilotrophus TaxID=1333667 RepID=A0A1I0IQB2_9ACTN|nr:hypothetical protein SAMN04488546_4573 [Geodermatophilus poikilotrophus]